jgi:flagellar basal body-associated protein FliL
MQALAGNPDQKTSDYLWLILVSGLVLVLAVAVIGLIVWAGHSMAQTDKIVTVIAAVLAGLLGLFVTSPTK